jgi:drug/metabolite transporter (DMT)-like permease
LNKISIILTKDKTLPYLALVVAILATSVGGFLVRWANAPGMVTVFYRTGISSILVAPFLTRNINNNKNFSKKIFRFIPIALLGGLFIALDQAANTTYFNSLAPLWVAIFALIFFKEKLPAIFWVGLFLALGGTMLILGFDLMKMPDIRPGDLLGLLSSFFFGGYLLITQIGRRHMNTLTYTWVATFSAAICLGLINWIFGQSIIGYSPTSYMFFLGSALLSQVIGYLSMSYVLGHLPATIVSPALLTKPINVAILAFIIFGESLSRQELLGGVFVLLGLYLINKNELRFAKNNSHHKNNIQDDKN